MEGIINKTLDLADLEKEDYISVTKEIYELMSILTARGLRFTTYQAEFDTDWGEENIWFRRKLWEMCTIIVSSGLKKGHRVLDCGGASSILSFYLAQKGCTIDTVDIDWRNQGIVHNANHVAKAMNWKMVNLKASMTELPYKDEEIFDRIFSICVLEHLSKHDQIKAIREMVRVLKPDGIIGLTFDYGPSAYGEKYTDVNDINSHIVIPSNLKIMGNRDYQENAWFEEQPGKTWGSLFLKKTNGVSTLLICTAPQSRLKVKLLLLLKVLKEKIKGGLRKIGISRSTILYLALTRLFYKFGFIRK